MKNSLIIVVLGCLLVGFKLSAQGTESDSSTAQSTATTSVSQKLIESLDSSNEFYHTHKRAIQLLVEEGYPILAERYYLQEVLGESIKTAKNQEHNENGEAL